MNKLLVQFTVPGEPQGKGRAKAAKRGKFITMYTPDKTVAYEGLVAMAARERMSGPPTEAACAVTLRVRMSVPASWSQRKRDDALAGRIHPTKKPDIDNVEKAIFDGLNGVVWRDDVQVVEVTKTKRYAETPGVTVTIHELGA